MNDILGFALLSLTSFFTLLNPLGTMPVFMTMTAELDASDRTIIARKASFVALLTLVLFAFGGNFIFDLFGISVNGFRIVGGIIFFQMGMDMLQARLVKTKIAESEVKKYVNDISITPLAIPMISGPGAITNAIVLMRDADSIAKKAILIGSMSLIMLFVYVILSSSSKIIKALGPTGNNVLMRLMGLIIMVIAVEFFFSGLRPILRDIFIE